MDLFWKYILPTSMQTTVLMVVVAAFLSVALPARVDSFSGTGNHTLTSGDAPDSICPYAWRLPRNSGKQSYSNLMETYANKGGNWYNGSGHHTDIFFLAPINLMRSSNYNYNNASSGGDARYWMSSAFSINAANMRLDVWFYTQESGPRGYGYSLRCLAR